MKVGDLVQLIAAVLKPRVGVVMEVDNILPGNDPYNSAWVRWTDNTDWEIVYREDVIMLSGAINESR